MSKTPYYSIPMATKAIIEGVECTIEKIANGNIRVQHVAAQINAMHGIDTGGELSYEVHPCQQYQYGLLNAKLPAEEQALGAEQANNKPWWSLTAGERANLRE